MSTSVAAVDLGATSGRVILGQVSHNELSIRPVARFPNNPVRTIDGLHWNILELYRNVLVGLASAAREEPALSSVAVDSWAVDYALMRDGRMLGTPYHYRDTRTTAGVTEAHRLVNPRQLYASNGLQHLPFNTLYQLSADRLAGSLEPADGFLLIPDLINYWLTGVQAAESTNASTTGLVNIATGAWDDSLIESLQLPRNLFPEIISAGTRIGGLLPRVADEVGFTPRVSVTAVGSHDTASAVVAVPATTDDFAYISCGTWGLVGVELEEPELSEAGRLANFTNEGGVDGRVRYLHNVMGLWLLSESVRQWERTDPTLTLTGLLEAAANVSTPVSVFDANDPRFLTPGDMPARIADWCREHGQRAPQSPAETVRSILESLAEAFSAATRLASELSGKKVNVIHIVGGGSQNTLLCQLIADRSGLPVQAGPVEATAIGNVLIQSRTGDRSDQSLSALRSLVARAFVPTSYTPQSRV
ncbi:MAG TPA: rhamnulokinase family protein [Glaciihabitans sp.]|jgi:rhamnulokinase|nr:rhamnulokinase family protein [Glaciihabitans sp.]